MLAFLETSATLINTCSKPKSPKEIHNCKNVINIEYSPYSNSVKTPFKIIFEKKTAPAPTIISSSEKCFFNRTKSFNKQFYNTR